MIKGKYAMVTPIDAARKPAILFKKKWWQGIDAPKKRCKER
jgi:hypothetical protein